MQNYRDIKDPPNVKLAYDLIEFSPEIDSAIRFVTQNMLICETMKDAEQLSASRETKSGRTLGHIVNSLIFCNLKEIKVEIFLLKTVIVYNKLELKFQKNQVLKSSNNRKFVHFKRI